MARIHQLLEIQLRRPTFFGPLVNSLLCVFNQQQDTQMLPSVQCIFIGDCGVGKTTLLKTATHQKMHRLPTVGVDMISYNSDNLRLQCWDTSGQPRFIHVVQMFVKNCSIVVYIFDATLEKSFLSILQTHEQHHKQDKIYAAVCNKSDLPGATPAKYRELLAQKYPNIHFLTSNALENATETMEQIVSLIPASAKPAQQQECCTIA